MMSHIRSIIGNSALLFVSRIFSKLATIVTVVLIARVLNADLFGWYSSIVALTTLAGLVADFGLVIPTVRSASCSFGEENRIVSATLSTRITLSFLAMILFWIIGWTLHYPVVATMLLSLAAVLEVSMTGLVRTLEARQDMKTITIFSVSERVVYSVCVASGLFMFRSVEGVAWGAATSYVVMFLAAAYIVQLRYGTINIIFSVDEIWRQLRLGFPFFLIAIASALYYKVDTLILSAQRPPGDVGVYNAALRIIDAQVFIPVVVMASVFPTMSKYFQDRNQEFFTFVRHSMIIFVALGMGVGLLLFLSAPLIIHVLFSPDYYAAIPVLKTLSFMTMFYFIYFALGYVLMAMHQERKFTIVMIFVAVVNIACNTLVIPRYGYMGASILRASTEGLLTISLLLMVIFALRRARSGFDDDRANMLNDGTGSGQVEIPAVSV